MLHELRELPGDPKLQHKYAALAARQATLQAAIPPPPPTPAYVHPVRSPGVIFSTPYNPPLPRLKPQPLGISMMIFNRRAAIQRRWDRFAVLKDWESDLREEDSFLARVGVQGQGGYVKVLREQLSDIKESFQREAERNKVSTPFDWSSSHDRVLIDVDAHWTGASATGGAGKQASGAAARDQGPVEQNLSWLVFSLRGPVRSYAPRPATEPCTGICHADHAVGLLSSGRVDDSGIQ